MDEFETWWLAYPKKVSKGRARKDFLRARKKASLQELIDGAVRLGKLGREWQYLPYPSTWLNDEAWADQVPTGNTFDAGAFQRDWEIRANKQWSDDVRCPPRKDH